MGTVELEVTSQPGLDDLQAQIEHLQRQLAKARAKAAVEYLGETVPADLGTGGKLTSAAVKSRQVGMHGDGGGLWLQVTAGGRSWLFRFRWSGKGREMGLGSVAEIGLAEARGRATICRRLVRSGVDPIDRRRRLAAAAASEVKVLMFRKAAERYIKAHEPTWRNPKHAAQWPASLEAYVYPAIGNLSVQDVDTDQVLRILEPIWHTKPETATRVRGRIEAVLDWAAARKIRFGENPARWKGHLDKLLPAKAKVRAVRHYPALPYAEMNTFWQELQTRPGMGALALRFAILTATRSGEVRGATWGELDLEAKVWTVPASRMKAGREHRVPLSAEAVKLLEKIGEGAAADLVFPAARGGQLSDMTISAVMRRMNEDEEGAAWLDPQGREVVPHGFRSTFRDWAAEQTVFPSDLVEMALAHTIDSKVEAAYRRGDMLERRRALVDAWARHCLTPVVKAGNVTPIGAARAQ